MPFRPMLAAPVDFALLCYPVFASAKLDGVRAVKHGGQLISRSGKPIPNLAVQRKFANIPEGLDGELIWGTAFHKDVYRHTVSQVMSRNVSADNVRFFVFENYTLGGTFETRYEQLQKLELPLGVELLEQELIYGEHALLQLETEMLAKGYEGLILRRPSSPYKQNRSTVREGYMLKVKRFLDDEAMLVGVEELMINENAPIFDERGYQVRSSHQENLTPADTLGALICTTKEGVRFKIGTGFTVLQRKEIWESAHLYTGRLVKFKHLPHGAKDAPRHPVFLGWRDKLDMTDGGLPESPASAPQVPE